MPLYLAVDAGGTKTDVVLTDDHAILARARTGSIKRMRVDAATAEANLDAALKELTAASGLSLQDVTRSCVGTAGETVPLVVDWIRSAFGSRVGGELIVRGDVEVALDAGFYGGEGILVLAGTGSNVAARGPDGQLTGAGGYGPLLADQGSGHRIGLQGLRRIFLAKDEGRTTSLTEAVLHFWGVGSLNELVAFVHAEPRPDLSKVAPIVLACAQAGDALALEVLRQEGEDLAYLVRLLLRRAWPQAKTDAAKLPALAFAGSILQHYAPVRQALLDAVRAEFAGVEELLGVVDPVQGALWRARLGASA